MMKTRCFRGIVVLLSCIGVTVSPNAMAAPPALAPKPVLAAKPALAAKPIVQAPRDVALHEGGVLVGQMLNAQGVALAGAPVVVQTAGKEVARLHTDKDGNFRVAGLKGGVHMVNTSDQQSLYRLWAPHTAPPAAQRGLMLVSTTDVVRGQCGCGTPVCGSACGSTYPSCGGKKGGIGNWIANHPLIAAGAIATAIAVPLALDDDDDPPATP